jgi:hypothetical protein
MNKTILLSMATCFTALALSACTVAKLEARLEANPQCKDVVNPKTGAVMPCPGTDRAFYVAAGLEGPRKPKANPVTTTSTEAVVSTTTGVPVANNPNTTPTSSPSAASAPADCKPKLHQKTGGMLPCPPSE